MPAILKSRIALVAVLAALLIPIGLSSLRGLTHVLTCAEEVATPFTVIFEGQDAIVLSSATLTPDEPAGLCGGLDVDIAASTSGTDTAQLTITVDNPTEFDWRGTINVALTDGGALGPLIIPVPVGRVEAGGSAEKQLDVRLAQGTHEFNGRLLIGP